MNYSDTSINLSDSISGYITANEEECDTTQYLSVLSQDITLEDMNVTLTNEKVEESNHTELVTLEDINQPFLFKVDGTNEIYGVQVAQDEDGNLQKYQIQYSGDINGELVPMLETIQILPLDYEEEVISKETCSSIEVSETVDSFVIENTELIPNKSDINLENVVEIGENGWDIQGVNGDSPRPPTEPEDETNYDHCSIPQEVEDETHNSIKLSAVGIGTKVIPEDIEMDDDERHLIAIQHLELQHCIDQEELYEGASEENQVVFFEQEHVSEENEHMENCENMTEADIYHITNNGTINLENINESVNSVLKESVDLQPKTNILKKPSQRSLLKDFINSDQRVVYVQTLTEKENIMNIESFIKPNSRSLLKCNQPDVSKQTDSSRKPSRSTKETKANQSYCRTKESKQARQFMNFINSTTITQVPERKERLPRKQQIKPLEHPDEDIVVKEMIVSSNGFIEPGSLKERKHLPVTDYVELLDSGDESNPLGSNKKKRKNNRKDKLVEIEISDTESESMELEPEKTVTRKKRGRPSKSKTGTQEKKNSYPNSPPKISRLESEVESVTSTLQVIRMENETECDKHEGNVKKVNEIEIESEQVSTEPKNTLEKDCEEVNVDEKCKKMEVTTELQEKPSLAATKIKGSQNFEEILKKGFDYKYGCEKCKSKFVNKFLLSRHDCIGKLKSTSTCDVCKQKFANNASLNLHKKSHNKEPSNLTKIPKTKIPEKPVFSSSSTKSSSTNSRYSTASKPALRIPSRQSILPTKISKPTFSVKNSKQPGLPLKGKQMSAPLKSVGKISNNLTVNSKNSSSCKPVETSKDVIERDTFKSPIIQVTPEKTAKSYTFKCQKQCDKCSQQFDNNTEWFNHQVLNHGFKTPDKSIGETKLKKIVKEVVTHNGIPAAPRVTKNFSILRNRIQQI